MSPSHTRFGEQAGLWSWHSSGGTQGSGCCCWCQEVLASNGSPRRDCEQEQSHDVWQTGQEFPIQAIN